MIELCFCPQVEAAIDEYFSQNYIVPSPWVGQSGAKHQSRLNDLMDCNGSPILNPEAKERGAADGQNGMANTSVINAGNQPIASSCRCVLAMCMIPFRW